MVNQLSALAKLLCTSLEDIGATGPLSVRMQGAAMSSTSPRTSRYALTAVFRSASGQVAAVAAFMEQHGAYVEQFAVYDGAAYLAHFF